MKKGGNIPVIINLQQAGLKFLIFNLFPQKYLTCAKNHTKKTRKVRAFN